MSDSIPIQIDTPQTAAASRGLVLVVDDEQLNRIVMCKVLQGNGFCTIEAENGRQALNAIQSNDVDLVLLDIVMPEMDGFETLRRMRNEMPELDIPVIMVTANEGSETVIEAFDLGANDFINKPFDPAVTLARINLHLQFAKSRADLRKSEERYALVAQGTNDGLWDWDLGRDEIFFSRRWYGMLGLEESETPTPDTWFSRIHSEDLPRVMDEIKAHFGGRTPHLETEMRMRHVDGSFRWTLCRGQAVFNANGLANRIAGSLTDITEGKVADALTGLPNRVLFRERLERCIYRQKRDSNSKFALLYLDLDNFKLVNDSLGHEAGDRLLVAIARRLESSLREAESFVCRLGGDEFSILIEGIDDLDEPIHIAKRIIASIGEPISIGSGREVYTSVSVGISFSSDGYADANEIIQAADTAMYRAKEQGKSCYRIFDPAMKQDATKRLNIENELRQAVDRQELECHFQPIVDIASGQVTSFEALVRWTHDKLGQVSPSEFIPIAEDNGLIDRIGLVVLRKACSQLAAWQKMDPQFVGLQVNVNLSSRQLKSTNLIDQIFEIIDETGILPACLKLEVTESTIMENPEQGAKVLSLLQSRGVKVAIDDFGTGYSSLACIHELSPDAVKIDRSFVDQLQSSADKKTIVRAIIGLADGLNLDVVAEGVETEDQHDILAAMGCKYAQGYLYAKPLPPRDLFQFVIENNSAIDSKSRVVPPVILPETQNLPSVQMPTRP
jgi:diguanylate cyclase (GGDEF)-like protein/PAS domain S-box-containing protein